MVSVKKFVYRFYPDNRELAKATWGLLKELKEKRRVEAEPEELLGALLFVAAQYEVGLEGKIPKKMIAHRLGINSGKFDATCDAVRNRLGVEPKLYHEPSYNGKTAKKREIRFKVEVERQSSEKTEYQSPEPSPGFEVSELQGTDSLQVPSGFPYQDVLELTDESKAERAAQLFGETFEESSRGRPKDPSLYAALSLAYTFVELGEQKKGVELGMEMSGRSYEAFHRALLRYDAAVAPFLLKETALELGVEPLEGDVRLYGKAKKNVFLEGRKKVRYAVVLYSLDRKEREKVCRRCGQELLEFESYIEWISLNV